MTDDAHQLCVLAGEASGDILGSSLMRTLNQREQAFSYSGIGGPLMCAEGLCSQVEMERLSVMGLFEPLKRLPELLRIKRNVVDHCLDNRPNAFIGIDSPDFNLRVARDVHAAGIPTVHYVSPSVWAWRQKRVLGIKQSVDLMLTLFPFEEAFYQAHGVPVKFVGHPLADELPMERQQAKWRQQLALSPDLMSREIVAVLPGSRVGEATRMLPLFLAAIKLIEKQKPGLQYLIPAANSVLLDALKVLLQGFEYADQVHLIEGQSQAAMGAADVALLASGTVTLEAMLLKTPMVMAYKLSGMTYQIVRHMVKAPHFALPNLLADEALVPEFIQTDATADNIAKAVLKELQDEEHRAQLQQRFVEIHTNIRCDASAVAAEAICELINR